MIMIGEEQLKIFNNLQPWDIVDFCYPEYRVDEPEENEGVLVVDSVTEPGQTGILPSNRVHSL